jgi:DNA-binding winged helix-turn-helix (wHTH) protein/tetratricopeptide (TPR) repeat protein
MRWSASDGLKSVLDGRIASPHNLRCCFPLPSGFRTMKTTTKRTAMFGPYALDLRSAELRKFGTKVKMGEQTFQILRMLLESPGELVSREELRAKLWAEDTFVDFDHGLNSAVQRLRDCLSDSAERPRWVETVPRRGYRFVGQVEWSCDGLSLGISRKPSSENRYEHSDLEAQASGVETPESPERAKGSWRRIALLGAVALVVLVAMMAIARRIQHARLAIRDTIVLADFMNSTGDAVFDDTLKTALSVSLRQSPFLNMLPESEVANTLRLMTRPAGTKLTPEVARELCLRAGSKAYILGAIGSLGSEYVLRLQAVNCQSGDTLAQEQVTAASKVKVLDSLGKAASRLREELGESLASVQKFDVPLEQATTASLDALKAHSLGRKADHEQGAAAALAYDIRAIEIDPNFAMGYLTMGGDYEDLGQRGRASEYYSKAFHLREHASQREKLRITAVYYDTVTGELYKAAETYQEEIDSYPRESMAYFSLAYVYSLLGQYEKAVEIVKQGMRTIPPDRVESLGGGTLFTSALALQRFDEAQQAIDELQLRRVDDERIRLVRYILCILGTDSASMAEQQEWFMGKPNFENLVLALASDTQAYAGHLSRSRELTEQAVDSALRSDSKETGAKWLAIAAQREAAYGYAAQARQKAAKALSLAPEDQGVESGAALAFALVGDTARAQFLAKDLGRRYPLDTQVQSLWLPTIQGQLALDGKDPTQALKGLQVASTIEFGGIPSVINNSCLYHVYVRGEAYLAAGQGSAAAAEFRKILDHKGIVWNCWTGAMSRLGAARANALQARTSQGADADAARVRALAAYKDFLTLWKGADPDIPILKEAKAEYAKLE